MHFPLVAEAEDTYEGPGWNEAIERHVPGATVRDQQFTDFAGNAAAHQWVLFQYGDSREYRYSRIDRGRRVLLGQEPQEPVKMLTRLAREDYLRHGLGRGTFCP